MKIAIDARILKTGIGTYTKALINELVNIIGKDDRLIIFLRSEDTETFSISDERVTKIKVDIKPYSIAEQMLFPLILWKTNPDIIHFTTFNVPILWWRKYVVTIHDLIHLRHSTFGNVTKNYLYYLLKKLIYVFVIKWVTLRASKVITDSNTTKFDLTNTLKVNENKIEVIPLAGNPEKIKLFKTETQTLLTLEKYKIAKPYILYVATMYPHKNHRRLIDAFKVVKETNPNIQLVLVGKVDAMSEIIKKYVINQGLQDNIILPNYHTNDGYLSDKELSDLYQNAEMYIYPSLQEGFGIPILEAQEYNIPVASSNIDCLREIGGDSVFYFDPTNIREISQAIQQVLSDIKIRTELIEKGKINIQKYSWVKLADQTYQVYRKIFSKIDK